jgi:hypothetical protein
MHAAILYIQRSSTRLLLALLRSVQSLCEPMLRLEAVTGFVHPKGDFFPGYSRRFLPTISSIFQDYFDSLQSPPTRFFTQLIKYLNKERKKTREIRFYILPLNSRTFQGFAEYCLEIKDISGLFRISFFFKDIPGIPGAVRTLSKPRLYCHRSTQYIVHLCRSRHSCQRGTNTVYCVRSRHDIPAMYPGVSL